MASEYGTTATILVQIDACQTTGDADAFAKALEDGGYAGFHNMIYADSLTSMVRATSSIDTTP